MSSSSFVFFVLVLQFFDGLHLQKRLFLIITEFFHVFAVAKFSIIMQVVSQNKTNNTLLVAHIPLVRYEYNNDL
jgi:hypothetical protein